MFGNYKSFLRAMKNSWSKIKYIRFVIFIFGVVITTSAWFLDNALEFKPVINFIAPNYMPVKNVLDQLDISEKEKVSIEDKGSQILLGWWEPKPPTNLKPSITYIGRSTGLFNIKTGRHRYELRLLTEQDGSMFLGPYVWQDYKAKKILQDEIQSGIFKWKAGIFACGILISVISGSWEFFNRKPKQRLQWTADRPPRSLSRAVSKEGCLSQMDEIEFLLSLFHRKTLDKMSKDHKVAYKYCLISICLNLIVGANHTEVQKVSFEKAIQIQNLPRKTTDFKGIVRQIKPIIEKSLKTNHFKEPYNDSFINWIIQFTRIRLNDLNKKNKSLFQVKELSTYLEVKEFFGFNSVANHHWVDLNLHSGFILTIPEAIIFHDFKAIWNQYVRTKTLIEKQMAKVTSEKEHFEYFQKPEVRELTYSKYAYIRSLILLCTIFVESYLYNLFCSLKHSEIEGKDSLGAIFETKKIEDEEIVKKIIYKLFPSVKDSTKYLFKKYKDVLKIRNRYVHASPFSTASGDISELQPILNISDDLLLSSLKDSIDFIKALDQALPEQYANLFWWYDGEIDFSKVMLLKLTNPNATYNRIRYENAE